MINTPGDRTPQDEGELYAARAKLNDTLIEIGDQAIAEEYTANPELYTYAAQKAEYIAVALLADGLDVDAKAAPHALDRLKKAVTKVVFSFTRPEDLNDTVADKDIGLAFMNLVMANAEMSVNGIAFNFDLLATHWFTMNHHFRGDGRWNPMMDSRMRFWYTVGHVDSGTSEANRQSPRPQ